MVEYSIFLLLCSITGLSVGVIGGMLGIGGGAIIVPVLLALYGQWSGITNITELAVATSLGSIFFTSISASYAQFRKKNVDWSAVRLWMLPVMLGSASAGQVASLLPTYGLLGFISILLCTIAIIMLTNWKPTPGKAMPGKPAVTGLGSLSGLMAGMAGIGGANIIIPTMLYFNFSYVRAAALASTLGAPLALAGTLGFMWSGWGTQTLPAGTWGYVHWPAVLAIAATSTIMAPIGVNLAQKIPTGTLKKIFAVLLFVTASRMLWLSYHDFHMDMIGGML